MESAVVALAIAVVALAVSAATKIAGQTRRPLNSTAAKARPVGGQIGVALGKLSSVTAAALVCAGLLSVLIFPLIALGLLRRDEPDSAPVPDVPAPVAEPHLM